MWALARIVLISAALALGTAKTAWSDFETGKKAYEAKDYATALRDLLPVAEQGDARAHSILGEMYERGHGTIKDYKKALTFHRFAAERGIGKSQEMLGIMYLGGLGLAKEKVKGLEWVRRAANQGYLSAQNTLAALYSHGLGVAKDKKEAARWYRKAAEQGFMDSQYNLALMYINGDGIDANVFRAAKWYAKAAAQGHVHSQYNLGLLYEHGEGVERNDDRAVEFFRSAAAQGSEPAAKRLQALLARIGSKDHKAIEEPINRLDDVAVIIGNANYQKFGKDIPNVVPAHADADAFKKWLVKDKGLREGNIIFLKDATSAQIESMFGNERSHKGQLFNWVKANISNIYVYYAGHGAPASDGSSAYLVPADATASSIELTGYPLVTLYENLKKIPAKSITLVLESCFSGASQGGYVISRTSGILVTPKIPRAPRNITVISAGKADQVASWEQDDSHSLFTKYFLLGMEGAADKAPHGNGDGKVAYGELSKYLDGTMTYYARRYYGRDQNAQIVTTLE
ncbi:MAG: hypothetical protein HN461_12310 [Rhodospirillaceae bacterium]|nr:hypothetical protein [Rhodospirillaceae bacterium]